MTERCWRDPRRRKWQHSERGCARTNTPAGTGDAKACGEMKYNELTVTHRTYMFSGAVREGRRQTCAFSYDLGGGKTAAAFTKAALENANLLGADPRFPYPNHAGFSWAIVPPARYPRNTELATGIKGCISRRGAGTMNPFTLETWRVVGRRRWPRRALGAHQQSLHKGYWDDNAGVTRRPMSASSRSLVHS